MYGPVQPDEGRLYGIFGILPVTEHRHPRLEQGLLEVVVDRFKRLQVTLPATRNEPLFIFNHNTHLMATSGALRAKLRTDLYN